MGSPHRSPAGAPRRSDPRSRIAHAALNRATSVAEAPRRARDERVRRAFAGGAGYPVALADLSDVPPCVFLRGAPVPDAGRCVALVGSRAASPYGLAIAERLARDLAMLGCTIVSGLARGIDAAAHRGALAAGGATVAVIPSGLDTITPAHHETLAGQVAERGTLLSEVESGPPFGPGAFVRRNRLIAALAAMTVVVEAAERSGALSTAAAARRLGRAWGAVPGDADRPTARGALVLLRAGARLVTDAGDVVAALPVPATGGAGETGASSRLAAALDEAPRTAEDLAERAGLAPADAFAELLRLEWAGLAQALPGPRWRRASGGRA